jgi:hypothetical protein
MRLRIEMGSQDKGNQRVTTEDGELVEGVKAIRWSSKAAERPIIEIEFFPERVDIDLGAPSTEEG